MKKIFLLIAVSLICLACEVTYKRDVVKQDENEFEYVYDGYESYIVRHVTYKGHKYIVFGNDIVHDPDCPCHHDIEKQDIVE